MSNNPYQSPSTVPSSQTPQGGIANYVYRSARGLVTWLVVLFVAHMVLNALLTVMSALEATVFFDAMIAEDFVDDPGAMAFALGYGCLGLILVPTYIANVVLFCVWINRANKNARALGAQGMTFTPGWSVGWFFVPIAYLFKPYQATCEIYKASNPTQDTHSWQHASVPTLFGAWWTLWIISNILGNIEMRLGFQSDPDLVLAGSWLGVVTGILGIPTAYLAMQVVRTIHNRQEETASSITTIQPPATPFGEVGIQPMG